MEIFFTDNTFTDPVERDLFLEKCRVRLFMFQDTLVKCRSFCYLAFCLSLGGKYLLLRARLRGIWDGRERQTEIKVLN